MTQLQLNQLIRIYNTLTTVSTKGEDTITMADCLRAFKQSIEELQRIPQQEEIKECIVNG